MYLTSTAAVVVFVGGCAGRSIRQGQWRASPHVAGSAGVPEVVECHSRGHGDDEEDDARRWARKVRQFHRPRDVGQDARPIHSSSMPADPLAATLRTYAERWVRSVKEECLSKVVLFGERSLRRAPSEYVEHFHAERNHQGKGNVLLFPHESHICREGPCAKPRETGWALALLPR
jgi:hypothetical protein